MDKYKKYIQESVIDEGKYAKYLESGKTKKTMRKDMIKDYENLVRKFKKSYIEVNKKIEAHIKKQKKDPENKIYIVEMNSYLELINKLLDEMDILRRI